MADVSSMTGEKSVPHLDLQPVAFETSGRSTCGTEVLNSNFQGQHELRIWANLVSRRKSSEVPTAVYLGKPLRDKQSRN